MNESLSKFVEPVLHSSAHHRLNALPSGSRVIVREIFQTDEAVGRLMAMGLCVGREVEVIRQGNPLILRLLGARVGISDRIARQILVERR